jgi:hypothetical protein
VEKITGDSRSRFGDVELAGEIGSWRAGFSAAPRLGGLFVRVAELARLANLLSVEVRRHFLVIHDVILGIETPYCVGLCKRARMKLATRREGAV